jgi:hypothetical protein
VAPAQKAVRPAGWAGFARVQQAAVPHKRAVFARAPQAVGRFEAQHCATDFKSFSIVLNSRNYFKLQKP